MLNKQTTEINSDENQERLRKNKKRLWFCGMALIIFGITCFVGGGFSLFYAVTFIVGGETGHQPEVIEIIGSILLAMLPLIVSIISLLTGLFLKKGSRVIRINETEETFWRKR